MVRVIERTSPFREVSRFRILRWSNKNCSFFLQSRTYSLVFFVCPSGSSLRSMIGVSNVLYYSFSRIFPMRFALRIRTGSKWQHFSLNIHFILDICLLFVVYPAAAAAGVDLHVHIKSCAAAAAAVNEYYCEITSRSQRLKRKRDRLWGRATTTNSHEQCKCVCVCFFYIRRSFPALNHDLF